MYKYILASASPRRKELLEKLNINFSIQVATKEEIIKEEMPEKIVEELSLQKAREISEHYRNSKEQIVIIGADTIVAIQDTILGKPQNEEEAKRMLESLAGREHEVYTGVSIICLMQTKVKEITFYQQTKVKFSPLSQGEIEQYIASKEPLDKAGAYGIQGLGAKFVEYIQGDYYNVMGLPLAKLYQVLKEENLIEL